MFQQVLQRTPPNSPDLPTVLNNLGTSRRYGRTGHWKNLEEAIRVFQQAVPRTPPDSPELPTRLNNLGIGLSDRYVGSVGWRTWKMRLAFASSGG